MSYCSIFQLPSIDSLNWLIDLLHLVKSEQLSTAQVTFFLRKMKWKFPLAYLLNIFSTFTLTLFSSFFAFRIKGPTSCRGLECGHFTPSSPQTKSRGDIRMVNISTHWVSLQKLCDFEARWFNCGPLVAGKRWLKLMVSSHPPEILIHSLDSFQTCVYVNFGYSTEWFNLGLCLLNFSPLIAKKNPSNVGLRSIFQGWF